MGSDQSDHDRAAPGAAGTAAQETVIAAERDEAVRAR